MELNVFLHAVAKSMQEDIFMILVVCGSESLKYPKNEFINLADFSLGDSEAIIFGRLTILLFIFDF